AVELRAGRVVRDGVAVAGHPDPGGDVARRRRAVDRVAVAAHVDPGAEVVAGRAPVDGVAVAGDGHPGRGEPGAGRLGVAAGTLAHPPGGGAAVDGGDLLEVEGHAAARREFRAARGGADLHERDAVAAVRVTQRHVAADEGEGLRVLPADRDFLGARPAGLL